MNRSLSVILCACLLLTVPPTVIAQVDDWPKTVPVGAGLVTIYPLQVEDLDGTTLRYRAALALREAADAEPVFGAGWFESSVVIDQSNGIVRPQDLKVTQIRFPAGTAYIQTELAAALAEQSPGWDLDVPLDKLNAGLRTAEAEKESLRELNTAPPRIVYRDRPALLLTLDGEPVLREISDTPYQAVVNTPYPLIFDGKRYYLNAARDVWYRADSATGPYRYEAAPPAEVAAMVRPDESAGVDETAVETPAEPVTAANAPEIVVATEPTELIVTDGPAVFVPLVDDLLVLQNSDDDVFMHVGTQQYYVVLAGRWYRGDSLTGPWAYQGADELPAAFAEIPDDSAQADTRVYVAGTPEAEDAVLDAQVPETRAVARGPAEVEVKYDGEPQFAPVDGTELTYAANTDSTVLRSNRRYYLVEDGVWYESAAPGGPWSVAAQRPADVETIAPTSPVYNVKYVYIYDSTPEVVYVGYTPGYLGSYVYYDTVVYGTGWHYRPWVSHRYYYPRPSTWGFHAYYDPWYGWNFGLSWNWGWGWDWRPYYGGFYSGGYWHHNHHWNYRHRGYWRPRGHHSGPHRYAHRDDPRDRHGRGAHRGDRRVYAGNYRDRDLGRHRDRVGPADRNGARDAVSPDRVKARRHQTDPVYASDLRLKARARDATFTDRSKARRHRTEPVDTADLRQKARGRDTALADRSKARRHRTEPVDAADLRQKARVRDTAPADRSKARRHRIEPVDAADLRYKARAQDDSAAGVRDRRVADSRTGFRSGASGPDARRTAQAPAGNRAKVARNRTEPVLADRPQHTDRTQRTDRARSQSSAAGVQRHGPRADTALTARRAGAATQPPDRRAAPVQQRQTRTVSAHPGSRAPVARRDQSRSAPAVRARQAPPPAGGNRTAPAPASRMATSPPRAAAAPRAAPAPRSNRSAAAPPRQRSDAHNTGRRASAGQDGAHRGRKGRDKRQ